MPIDYALLAAPDKPPILAYRNGYEWLLVATAEVTGTAVATIGGVTATATGLPTVLGTAQATIGGVTASAVATVTTPGAGIALATIGPVTATALGLPTVHGTAVVTIGPVVATIVGLPTVRGTMVATIGPVVASAIGILLVPVRQSRIVTAEDILDGRVLQRSEGLLFELLDANLQRIGELHPVVTPASIEANTEATIARVLRNLVLIPSEVADIDTYSTRLRPSWLLETGDKYPIGVFMFQARDLELRSYGGFTLCSLLADQTWILAQGRRSTFSVAPGALLSDQLRTLAAESGFLDLSGIEGSSITAANVMGWPTGTTRLEMMRQLCNRLGYYPPYFDNAGKLICRSVPNLDLASPDHVYNPDETSRIVDESGTASDNAWEAPNVYVVVNTSATAVPIVGVYEIPSDAPNSAFHRGGFEVVKTIDAPGVESVEQAEAMAKAAYAQDSSSAWVDFDGVPDPRHDLFQIVEFDGLNYREKGWSLALEAGGKHHHSLRRVFAA